MPPREEQKKNPAYLETLMQMNLLGAHPEIIFILFLTKFFLTLQ